MFHAKRNRAAIYRQSAWVHGLAIIGVFAAVLALLELFPVYDWDCGVLRAFMVAALGLLLIGLRRFACCPEWSAQTGKIISSFLLLAAVLFAGVCFDAAMSSIRRTSGGSEILLDQGQIHYRAVQWLGGGVNPYSRSAILDPAEYDAMLKTSPCLIGSADEYRSAMDRYWKRADAGKIPEQVRLQMKAGPECRQWIRSAESLGYKYGPVLLAVYWPFVKLMDKAGVYWNHLVVLILFAGAMIYGCRRRYGLKAGIFLVPIIWILAPSILRHNVLHLSAADLLPAGLAVLAALCCMEKRFAPAAILLALSISAKPLPGILYIPLLSRARWKHWATVFFVCAGIYGPFLLRDFEGFINNLVRFNFSRAADSTALLYYIPLPAAAVISCLAAIGIVWLAWRGHRRHWDADVMLEFLLGTHVLVFIAGRIFHNNYLIWILPLIGLMAADVLNPKQEAAEAED